MIVVCQSNAHHEYIFLLLYQECSRRTCDMSTSESYEIGFLPAEIFYRAYPKFWTWPHFIRISYWIPNTKILYHIIQETIYSK